RSSNFGIDVKASLDVVGALALIIKGVKLALDKLGKFRKLKEDAEQLGVDAVVDEVTRKSKESLEVAIDEIEAEVFQHCKLDNDGRINELKTALKFKINGLANRMERGFAFEVRSTLPPSADEKAVGMHEIV